MVWDGSDYLLLNEPTGNRVVLTLESEIVACGNKDLLTDPLGSLVKEISSGASLGSLVEMYPYGTQVPLTARTSTPFVFVAAYGYYKDNLDRDYVRARSLMKKLGRCMQTDPLWPFESIYAYTNCKPVDYRDPSGKSCLDSDCEKSCNDAIPTICNSIPPSPPYPPNVVVMAFFHCCKGKPYHCFCPGRKPRNPYILACVIVHERGHFIPGACPSGHTGAPFKWANECTALKAGIKCATEQCKHKITNDCLELDEWRCYECRCLKLACKDEMPSQSWIDQYCKGCGV